MAYWQVFAGERWVFSGLDRRLRGWHTSAHCRPYDTPEQARDGILEYDYPDRFVYVVEAPTSLAAMHLVESTFASKRFSANVQFVGRIGPDGNPPLTPETR